MFQVGDIEMDQLLRRMQMKQTLASKGFVRIRGLPYNCNKEQVQQFFRGKFFRCLREHFQVLALYGRLNIPTFVDGTEF